VTTRNRALMSSTPIGDNENGVLQIKTMDGEDYIKVYDPLLNTTMWRVWDPLSSSSSSGGKSLLMPHRQYWPHPTRRRSRRSHPAAGPR